MSAGRLAVGILGATGAVGQKLVAMLAAHPWFEVTVLAASERSAGRRDRDAVHWLEPVALPERAGDLIVQGVASSLPCDLALSALAAATAREAEPAIAAAGTPVVSNASAFRMHPRVPLVIPEVNPDHLDLVATQEFGGGFIVTNPNCSTVGLTAALKPLYDAFGVEAAQVTTLQAVSGAGYPGVPALDILGNVIPGIDGEEDKLETEPGKLLGKLAGGSIEPAPVRISAQTTRVPVVDGHLLTVSVRLGTRACAVDARRALAEYRSPIADLALPSAPTRFLTVLDGDAAPQPRFHASLGGGMTVAIGRVRHCPVLDVRFVVLVHNIVRGAAGAAILNAELLVARGLIGCRRPARRPPLEPL